MQKRRRKVDNENVKCRERTRAKTRYFSQNLTTQAYIRKTINSSNYFSYDEGVYYNLLGIWEARARIIAACRFAEVFQNVLTDSEKF